MTIISEFKLGYRYSLFWLIFWLIAFLPIGVVLLLTGAQFKSGNSHYQINYGGSRFWFCFWSAVFFPVAILLGIFNGFSLVKEQDIVSSHIHQQGGSCCG